MHVEGFVRLSEGRRTGFVHAAYAEAVTAALFHQSGLEPIERGGRGTIWRFSYPGGHGIVRQFRRGGFIARFLSDSYWFRNRPLREFRVHAEALSREVAAPLLLGVAWERGGAAYRGWIATREVDGAPLDEYCTTNPRDRDRGLRRAGEAIRRMHDTGILHADLQTGNILVGDGVVHIIDFDRARAVHHASAGARARNLSRLRRSMIKRGLTDGDFWKLFMGYGNAPKVSTLLARGRIGQAAEWVKTVRRIVRWRTHYIVKRLEPGFFGPNQKWDGRERFELAPGIERKRVLDALKAPGELMKRSRSFITKRVGPWVIKAAWYQGLWRQLTDPERSRRGWDAARWLAESRVSVPRPIAYVERRIMGIVTRSAVVSEFLEGAVNVEAYARQLAQNDDTNAPRAFLAKLAAAVDAIARAGAWHADLSGKNIFTSDGKVFTFIDLDSVHLHARDTDERRLKNAVQLYDGFCDVWDDAVLGPFINALAPEGKDAGLWLAQTKAEQRKRRTLQLALWKQQGRSKPTDD